MHFSTFATALLASAALLPLNVDAYFVLGASKPVVVQRLDPIMADNKPVASGHTHTFVGSNSVAASMTYNSLRGAFDGFQKGREFIATTAKGGDDGSCTTTGLWADASSYWSPSLYYRNEDSTYSAVPLSFARLYYFNRVGNKEKGKGQTQAKAFPEGLRMIAGNAMQFDTQKFNSSNHAPAKAISFVCLNYKAKSSQTDTIPTGSCPDGLRMQVTFASCWNGKDLDSKVHQSHMAYPSGIDNGDCPDTHPIRLATLFNEWVYSTGSMPNGGNNPDNSHLVLSNGDMYGTSFHADFVNGWMVDVLQQALEQCEYSNHPNDKDLKFLDARIGLCPPLVPYIASQLKAPDSTPGVGNCTVAPVVKDTEDVTGSDLKYLPGCNPIRFGPLKQTADDLKGCSAAATVSGTAPAPGTGGTAYGTDSDDSSAVGTGSGPSSSPGKTSSGKSDQPAPASANPGKNQLASAPNAGSSAVPGFDKGAGSSATCHSHYKRHVQGHKGFQKRSRSTLTSPYNVRLDHRFT